MFNSAYYNLSKEEKLAQSIKYISNYLVRLAKDGIGSVIGITSTLPYKTSKGDICKKIGYEIARSSNKLMYVNISLEDNKTESIEDRKENKDFKELYLANYSTDKLFNLLNNEKKNYDIVLVDLPPVLIIAETILYAQVCDRVVLLERYMYTNYNKYEEALVTLKSNKVKLDGVITYN